MKGKEFYPIAVVGISALYPGASDKQTFWKNILDGKDSIQNVPQDYWLINDYFHDDTSNTSKEAKTYSKRGGFVPSVKFDPVEFGMPPKILSSTDTVQLLALIVAREVLKDAYCTQFEKVDKEKISVILGVTSSTELVIQMASKIQKPVWQKVLREQGLPESQVQEICTKLYNSYADWDESTFPGLLGNVIAGRITNRFNLGGTNCVVDAACASSHAAIDMAIQELQLGHSDLVISGGVDAANDIFMYMCFTRTPALSRTDDCRPFSKDADGMLLAEGIGMMALRRLEDAQRDKDRIYAVIRGVGSSSDGKAKSVYAPSPDGQTRAIIKAYEKAGYGLNDVELIEAHGTATNAGDVAEFEGLRKAMGHFGKEVGQDCALGSIKSQIGHAKAAAGTASIIKTVLALYHKVLPPTIKVAEPNPKLDIANSPFYLNTLTRPWIHDNSTTRKAGVSAFGFGGSNFHLTLEEYHDKNNPSQRILHSPVHLMLFSAENAQKLLEQVEGVVDEIPKKDPESIAKKLQFKFKSSLEKRLALIIQSEEDIKALFKVAKDKINTSPDTDFIVPGKIYFGSGKNRSKLAYLFPGQGSQYVNMGLDLAVQLNDVREVWDNTASIDFGVDEKLHEIVFPRPEFNEEDRKKHSEILRKTQWAQPAIGTVSVSQLKLLGKLGVKADCVAGHSYGEVTALYHSGVINSFEGFVKISRKRGELMAEASKEDGAMTAVLTTVEEVEKLLKEASTGVGIANFNSPSQTVISGKTFEIEKVEELLRAKGVSFKRLPVATAFHSSIVEQSAQPFYEFLKTVNINKPTITVFSNSSGEQYPNDIEEIRKILGLQLAKPVYFKQQIERMYDEGVRIFVEVGPGEVLSKLVDDCLKGKDYIVVSMDKNNQNGLISMWNALGLLSVSGVTMEYQKLWNDFELQMVSGIGQSPATVEINGSNYEKPYPPKGGANALPQPNPDITVISEKKNNEESKTSSIVMQHRKDEQAVVSGKQETYRTMNKESPKRIISDKPMSTLHFSDERLKVLQQLQQNTFEAQKLYQETVTNSHLKFLQASEEAFRQLSNIGGGHVYTNKANDEGSVSMETFNQDLLYTKTISKQEAPVLNQVGLESLLLKPSSFVGTQAVLKDNKKILLEVVSEKTGYPQEMIDMDMALETDLGIDSIKRVEILSALMEVIPGIDQLDTTKLSSLNTLREILNYTEGSSNQGSFEQTKSEKTLNESLNSKVEAGSIDFHKLLLEVVAEKTGYPEEMINISMDMETELGIDSIKRVEILSELNSRFPQIVELDITKLSAMRTLEEILDYFTNMGQGVHDEPQKKK